MCLIIYSRNVIIVITTASGRHCAIASHVHHHIGMTQKYPVHIGSFLRSHEGDPAIKVSSIAPTQTTSHVSRILYRNSSNIYCVASTSRNLPELVYLNTVSLIIKDDRLYHHSTARVNYTTYDVRRAQDVINPQTSHCLVTVYSSFRQDPPPPFVRAGLAERNGQSLAWRIQPPSLDARFRQGVPLCKDAFTQHPINLPYQYGRLVGYAWCDRFLVDRIWCRRRLVNHARCRLLADYGRCALVIFHQTRAG